MSAFLKRAISNKYVCAAVLICTACLRAHSSLKRLNPRSAARVYIAIA